jgi:hypothetical protein
LINDKDIERLFAGPLDRITDRALRAKVIRTFVLACERGKWESVDDLKRMSFTLLTETHGVNFIEHTIAVTEGAAALGRAQEEAYAKLPYVIISTASCRRLSTTSASSSRSSLTAGEASARAGTCPAPQLLGRSWRRMRPAPDIINHRLPRQGGRGGPQVVEAVLVHQADFATFDPLAMKQKGALIED